MRARNRGYYYVSNCALSSRASSTAQVEEKNGRPISDPAVQLLRRHIFATGGRVTGSDQARYQLRSQIWSTSIMLNPLAYG